MFELLTPNEMAMADKLTIEGGVPGYDLMNAAGIGVTESLADVYAPPQTFTILAGPGNNGGDGFVVARELVKRGYSVFVGLLGESDKLKGDAKLAYDEMVRNGVNAYPLSSKLVDKGSVIVDALFGTGLDRDIEGLPATVIEAANNSGKPIVSIDIPSGICGLSGEIRNVAINADLTVTFFRRKTGHLLFPGRKHSGTVKVIDIGIDEKVLAEVKPMVFRNGVDLWKRRFPIPIQEYHKYNRGHSVVFSGPMHSTGAARLCAESALRTGAGLVTMASPSAAVIVNATHLTSVMIRPVDSVEDVSELLKDSRYNTIAIGPGFGVGEKICEFVSIALDGSRSAVLDADALTSFSESPERLFNMIKNSQNSGVVLTPHYGEFSKLFSGVIEYGNKIDMARKAAEVSGAVIVLKGADTVIAAPDGTAAINDNAPAWLSTAGSGDVLCGMICGLMSQSTTTFDSACMGVWLHGAAAQRAGPGLISEDLPGALRPVIRDIIAVPTPD